MPLLFQVPTVQTSVKQINWKDWMWSWAYFFFHADNFCPAKSKLLVYFLPGKNDACYRIPHCSCYCATKAPICFWRDLGLIAHKLTFLLYYFHGKSGLRNTKARSKRCRVKQILFLCQIFQFFRIQMRSWKYSVVTDWHSSARFGDTDLYLLTICHCNIQRKKKKTKTKQETICAQNAKKYPLHKVILTLFRSKIVLWG